MVAIARGLKCSEGRGIGYGAGRGVFVYEGRGIGAHPNPTAESASPAANAQG